MGQLSVKYKFIYKTTQGVYILLQVHVMTLRDYTNFSCL